MNTEDKYFYLQIKEGTGPFYDCVDKWIKQNKFAAVFSQSSIKDLIAKKQGTSKDLQKFVEQFINDNGQTLIVSIGSKNMGNSIADFLYIYKKKGALTEYHSGDSQQYKVNPDYYQNQKLDNIIGFEIELLIEKSIVECPLVLATIKSNQYLSRGTFKQLKKVSKTDPDGIYNSYFGNRKAIDYLVKKKTSQTVQVDDFEQYLECLSAIEFETLLAKMKEEQGYFVPAYKGGSFKDYDILCYKDTGNEYIQAKLNLSKETYNKYNRIADLHIYCVHSEVDKKTNDNIFDYEDIKQQLVSCPKTKKWLKRSLYWVNQK